jgi:hypothetical protein
MRNLSAVSSRPSMWNNFDELQRLIKQSLLLWTR